MLKVFHRICPNLRDIFDLERIKDLQMLNSILEFALRVDEVFHRTYPNMRDIFDLRPISDSKRLNIAMLIVFDSALGSRLI
jgi:hypothetical protein